MLELQGAANTQLIIFLIFFFSVRVGARTTKKDDQVYKAWK